MALVGRGAQQELAVDRRRGERRAGGSGRRELAGIADPARLEVVRGDRPVLADEPVLALGLDQEAQKNAAVLGYNFPSSPWYLDSYALMNGGTSQ